MSAASWLLGVLKAADAAIEIAGAFIPNPTVKQLLATLDTALQAVIAELSGMHAEDVAGFKPAV